MHRTARKALLVATLITAPSLCAQSYPTKPVRVVRTGPARIERRRHRSHHYSPKLSEWLGRQFAVDNLPSPIPCLYKKPV